MINLDNSVNCEIDVMKSRVQTDVEKISNIASLNEVIPWHVRSDL